MYILFVRENIFNLFLVRAEFDINPTILSFLYRGNTEGWRCERCKSGFWGDPLRGCELCNCHQIGSMSNACDVVSGQCLCNPRYGGHHCDECEVSIIIL